MSQNCHARHCQLKVLLGREVVACLRFPNGASVEAWLSERSMRRSNLDTKHFTVHVKATISFGILTTRRRHLGNLTADNEKVVAPSFSELRPYCV